MSAPATRLDLRPQVGRPQPVERRWTALVSPAARSLLAISLADPAGRAKAFAVYGAIAGSGAAAGMLLGGVLPEYLPWRWCLYVNVPIAVGAAPGGWAVLKSGIAQGRP